ncbi:unnamed protein product [Diatraea saccharalis]|uniref:C2H2-type domain-containing protein n=1 Tax=Diatraea saccharalis TaxID=40085 RepID=A0A9P0C625_9NEOP|nr:unnamed protein product [Diatraea saccharalis]
MCTSCLNFIKEINKFCKNAENAHKRMFERLEKGEFKDIKPDLLKIKTENDIPTLDNFQDIHTDYNDDDDDIPLHNLQYDKSLETGKDKADEFENTVKVVAHEQDVIFKCERKKNLLKKPVKTKVRSKKENSDRLKNCKDKKDIKVAIECEYCHKTLTSKLSLRNHYKIHTGFDFVCEHCGKKFITRRLLLMHCRAKHGYEKTDKCSYCDYRASNAEQVKIHERLHTGEKPYVCSECGAGFHRKSSYLQHVAIHLPEKTVQCDQCPARFKSVTLMRIHKNRHRVPAFRFRCDLCGNTFARRRNVARHLTSVHRSTPDPKHIQRMKI